MVKKLSISSCHTLGHILL